MGKPQKMAIGDVPLGLSRVPGWQKSHGMMIAGRAYADEADLTASQMEQKWGCDRLRLLVPAELREKFDRQRYLFNQAIWHGELEAVRTQAQRMVKAWLALDKAATAAGAMRLDPNVWEVTLSDGTVAAIVPDNAHASAVTAQGRKTAVFTLDEIGRLLSDFPALAAAKIQWPGATVTAFGKNVGDPLDSIADTNAGLDDLNDDIPF